MTDTLSEADAALTIVKGLRSSRAREVEAAMKSLYGDDKALLVHVGAVSRLAIYNGVQDATMFTVLLNACQQLGNALGLSLQWVQQGGQPPQQGGILLPGSNKWVR